VLKVHDDAKGQSIENREINYFLAGDIQAKKNIPITITRREYRRKWVNPKYMAVWDVNKEDLGDLATNKLLTKFFEKYGTILDPVEDVIDLSEKAWSLDKKKFRIDLDKEKHIPRQCHLEIEDKNGEIRKGTIRITYKDQPWHCRRCMEEHEGECPKRMQDRLREKEIKEQKEMETKTLIIGDSNLKLVNKNALLADVIASSGAKIGHIANQLSWENTNKYENIVVFAGINNIPGQHERLDEKGVERQIDSEVKTLEAELAKT